MKITKVADANSFQNIHAVEAKRIYDTENAEAQQRLPATAN
jgi:hypothetical protein